MLLDSNIIIYAAQPEHDALRALVAEKSPAVSVISYIEVLGYHQLKQEEREFFEQFFQAGRFCLSPTKSLNVRFSSVARSACLWAMPSLPGRLWCMR